MLGIKAVTGPALLAWMVGCSCQDADPVPATASDGSSDSALPSDTGPTSTTPAAGSGETASASSSTADTSSTVEPFDTGGPACAGVGGATGLIEGGAPSVVGCTVDLPTAGTPGPVVQADDVALAVVLGHDGEALGRSIFPLGDSDGDGVGEVAIGKPGRASFGSDETQGEVWVFAGGALAGELHRSDTTSILKSRVRLGTPNAGQGKYLATGDLSGDGARDLVINGSGYQQTLVVPLPIPLGSHFMEDLAVASVDAPGGATLDHPSVGDVTGDGIPDLSLSGDAAPGLTGGVSVLEGPLGTFEQDPEDTWATYLMEERDDPYEVYRGQASGRSMLGVMFDVDGDGISEVVVGGDRLSNIQPVDGDATAQGGVGLFRGGQPGAQRSSDLMALAYGECSGHVGFNAARVGDVTGDCRPDLAVGASGFTLPGELARGAVYVVSEWHRAVGDVPIQAISAATIIGEDPGNELWSVGYLGDLNQDGYGDLVLGAPSAFAEGRVYIFLGPVAGVQLASDADLILAGSGGSFGYTVRGIFDVTGDGVPDLAVGAHVANDSDGKAYVFSGADLLALIP